MKLYDSDWSCGKALMYIFFSDSDRVCGESAYRKVVKKLLLYTLNNPDKNDGYEQLDQEELDLIKRLVKCIRLLPAKITAKSKLPPIVWIKLALHISFTGIPIANRFLKRYGEWRMEYQQSGKLALVVQDVSDVKTTMASLANSSDSLDVFLLTDIAEFNQLKHTYSIQYKAIDINDKGVEQNVEIPTAKARTKKSARDQIGENICLDVEWCINQVAKSNLGRFKFEEYTNNELVYSGTRTELLGRLREKFKGRLKGSGSDNVYLRAISMFVACKGCKRSKKSRNTKTAASNGKRLPLQHNA